MQKRSAIKQDTYVHADIEEYNAEIDSGALFA